MLCIVIHMIVVGTSVPMTIITTTTFFSSSFTHQWLITTHMSINRRFFLHPKDSSRI